MRWPLTRVDGGLKRLRKELEDGWKCVPQRLKPYLFSIVYVRAEARTLQRTELFRSLFSRAGPSQSGQGFRVCARTLEFGKPEGRTAGPSTTLLFGRDDTSVWGLEVGT